MNFLSIKKPKNLPKLKKIDFKLINDPLEKTIKKFINLLKYENRPPKNFNLNLWGLLESSYLTYKAVIKLIAKDHVSATPEDLQVKLINEAKAYIPPKELDNGSLTANIVMESLAVSILIDEYFMTLTNLPGLKDHLWNELEKNGISFEIWSNIDNALHNSK